eukprot:TRINITY_DN1765_c0_g1_i1.p2 TRINITY_DN1765_c0_g1~~TRINITY_DN1765_c0_g1_i1.p2  ORF type:complete len:125 (-),score=60.71 TRINITY_DN1765_c0_g1_i1:154-528(-)
MPVNNNITWKAEHTFEKRKEVSSKILSKYYPHRIPVIVEKAPGKDAPDIDKKKYLVPSDSTVGKFVSEIKKHMKISSEKSIFLFVNNALPPNAVVMSQLYERYKDEDGFLYITYSGESTFGSDQ